MSAMYQDLSLLMVVVVAIFTVQIVSADANSIFKDDNTAEKRFVALDDDDSSNEMPYNQQYWYYPHTSHNFLQTLLRYLAINEQSYRNTVKRQRTFGFMGSRGKRGDVEDINEYLRQLREAVERRRYGPLTQRSMFDSQKDDLLKIKRQPHRGFHGMRG